MYPEAKQTERRAVVYVLANLGLSQAAVARALGATKKTIGKDWRFLNLPQATTQTPEQEFGRLWLAFWELHTKGPTGPVEQRLLGVLEQLLGGGNNLVESLERMLIDESRVLSVLLRPSVPSEYAGLRRLMRALFGEYFEAFNPSREVFEQYWSELEAGSRPLPTSLEKVREDLSQILADLYRTNLYPAWDEATCQRVLADIDRELTPREVKVLWKRFFERMNLKDIGKEFGGFPKERIRQIEAKALRKLREEGHGWLLKATAEQLLKRALILMDMEVDVPELETGE